MLASPRVARDNGGGKLEHGINHCAFLRLHAISSRRSDAVDAETLAMLIAIPLAMVIVLTLTVGAVLVVRDTIRRRGKWGINTRPVRCPECGEPAPVVRVPENFRQTLWGGCTCANCGLEYDKWGRPVEEAVEDAEST